MSNQLTASKLKGSTLIEDWPQCSIERITLVLKHVTFSELSKRRVYKLEPSYEAAKSYKSADKKTFQRETSMEGFRIKHMISLCSLRTGPAIKLLLQHAVMSCEELLGIENLVWANPELALNGRRSYIDQVLGFQKEMQENWQLLPLHRVLVLSRRRGFEQHRLCDIISSCSGIWNK